MLDCLTVPDTKCNSNIMPQRISIILVNGHSMTSLSAILDPFQHVNSFLGREIFSYELVSLEEDRASSSTGIKIDCDTSINKHLESISPSTKPDLIFLCCGTNIEATSNTILLKYLRRIRRHFIHIVGLGAASRALVDAGLLLDGKCAVHWNSTASFGEQYCKIEIENTLFVKNGLVTSCPGELATFDLSASYISKVCGQKIANQVCSHFLSNNLRSGDALQFVAADIMTCDNFVFRKAFDIMHNNIEDPLKVCEIAWCVGVSSWQIERIFRNNGFLPPGRYYLNIRLEKARQLVEQTSMPLIEVAYACGFGSNSSFLKNYKNKYGITPRVSRKKGPRLKC